MATELTVPTLGMDMTEATIVKWLVSEGDEVEKGDPVLEIDTDKTSFEVEAPDTGIISNLKGDEGETLEVGTLIAYILEEGEDAPEAPGDGDSASEDSEAEQPEETPAEAKSSADDEGAPEPEAPEPDEDTGEKGGGSSVRTEGTSGESLDGKGLRASPAARKLAVERGLELAEIGGSGPNGRVYLSDVANFDGSTSSGQEQPEPEATEQEAPAQEAPAASQAAAPEAGTSREALTQVRKIGAQRTQQSFAEVPHFYLNRDVDADEMVALRSRLKERMEVAPSLNDLVAFAVSRVLLDHPRLNARYDDGELVMNESVNLGIAAATDKGLLVPVVAGADRLRLNKLSEKTRDLLGKAREGKLGRDEMSGGTFTISNLGMMGVDRFNAIINQPEGGILAIGSLRTVPEWNGESFVPKKVISMTLSVDHRVADGADGARFLQDLQDGLSNWELLM